MDRVAGRRTALAQLAIALLALLAGGMIYLLWRKDTLLMFAWVDAFGLLDPLGAVRHGVSAFSLPHWVVFSLPNALWLFSGLLILDAIWGSHRSVSRLLWSAALGLIAVGAEAGQALRVLPGTFDWQDVALMALAGFCAILFIATAKQQEGGQEA